MNPSVRQAQRIASGEEDASPGLQNNPGWEFTWNPAMAPGGSTNVHDGYTHYIAEAINDQGVITQDRRIHDALVKLGVYTISAPTKSMGSYVSAALSVGQGPGAHWRLSEATNQRVAQDIMGALPPNLCLNPSFEVDAAGWSANGTQVVQSVDSSAWVQGHMSLLLTPGGSRSDPYTTYTLSGLVVNGIYTCSVWVKPDSNGVAAGCPDRALFIDNGGIGGYPVKTLSSLTVGSWQRVSLTFEGSNTGTANIRLYCSQSTGNIHFDGVQFVQGSDPGFYYAGNGGNDGDYIGSFQPNLLNGVAGGWPSFESGIAGFTSDGTGAGIVQSSVQHFSGGWSALITAPTAGGQADAYWNGGSHGGQFAISANTVYTFSAYSMAATTGRSFSVQIQWYDNTNTFISSSGGTAVTTTTSGFTRASVTATSPSNAAFCRVLAYWTGCGANEQHYLDAGQLTTTPNVVPYSDTTGIQLQQTGLTTGGGETDKSVAFANGYAIIPGNALFTAPTFSWAVFLIPAPTTQSGGVNGPAFIWMGSWPHRGLWFRTNSASTQILFDVLNGADNTVVANVTPSQLVHVVGVYDGTAANLYINGALSGTPLVTTYVPPLSTDPTYIGGIVSTPYYDAYYGTEGEVTYYPFALQASDVANLYAAR